LTIQWDAVIIENTLLAATIVGSIYLERWLEEKARKRKEKEISKKTIIFIIDDLESKLKVYRRIKAVYGLQAFFH
jgi:hypothetical protein